MLSDAEWECALVDTRAGWETNERRLRAARATQALVDDRLEREQQLAEAQVARERAEARIAEWRGIAIHLRSHLELIAYAIDSGCERDLAEARVAVEDALNELAAVYCAPDPGADLLADVRALYEALARYPEFELLLMEAVKLSFPEWDGKVRVDKARGYQDLVDQVKEALAIGKRRGWDRPAEGEEEERW
jgi:hypothetical protein